MTDLWKSVLKTDVSREQSKDTGMALVLVFLLLTLVLKREVFLLWAIAIHVVNMAAPQIYRPTAIIWFSLANVLGVTVSRALLSIIFFALVTPVGLWRRVLGADSLRLKSFKAGSESVMLERNHTYAGTDIERPF